MGWQNKSKARNEETGEELLLKIINAFVCVFKIILNTFFKCNNPFEITFLDTHLISSDEMRSRKMSHTRTKTKCGIGRWKSAAIWWSHKVV